MFRFDSRLTLVDLNEESALNSLSHQLREDIWLPDVVFYNTETKSETLNDEKAFAVIQREGSYSRRNQSYLQNAYIFKGVENPIKLSRVYSDQFICDYDMTVYPFDKQECSAIFIMKGKFDKFVKLIAKNASYLGPVDLPQYFVMETKILQTTVPPGINAVQVNISFGRRILSTILSNYLPTFIICILTFCTNYFRGFYFEAIVTVNLTSMLALTTLFVSIFNSLPHTANIKMMDVWLIFCLTIPFLEVMLQVVILFFIYIYCIPQKSGKIFSTSIILNVFQTYLEHLRDSRPMEAKLVNHHGQVSVVRKGKSLHPTNRYRNPILSINSTHDIAIFCLELMLRKQLMIIMRATRLLDESKGWWS